MSTAAAKCTTYTSLNTLQNSQQFTDFTTILCTKRGSRAHGAAAFWEHSLHSLVQGLNSGWSQKRQYLKHVKMDEKLLWAYRISPTLFRTVPSPTPYNLSPSPRLGVRNPNPKLQSLLSQERVKLRTANLADTFIGSIQTEVHYKSHAIAGMTARCRCTCRYVWNFSTASRSFSATARLSCIVLHQLPFKCWN